MNIPSDRKIFEAIYAMYLGDYLAQEHEQTQRRVYFPIDVTAVAMVNDVYPYIGGRPVAELSAPEFLRVVRRMEERGAIESAHRVLQTCGR